MRKICIDCEIAEDTPECKKCTWPSRLKYPTEYKGVKYKSTKELREVIQ